MSNFTNKLTNFKSKFNQAGGKKSSKKSSKKSNNLKEPENIIKEIEKIEKNDENYRIKFNELKEAYIKKHNLLIDVFNGYQKLYSKVPN
jgi:hypothetical protein